MYLFLFAPAGHAWPTANIPLVEFPAAAPRFTVQHIDVAEALVSHAYVYLLVDEVLQPKVNMPLVEFPAAVPYWEFAEDAVADALVSVE